MSISQCVRWDSNSRGKTLEFDRQHLKHGTLCNLILSCLILAVQSNSYIRSISVIAAGIKVHWSVRLMKQSGATLARIFLFHMTDLKQMYLCVFRHLLQYTCIYGYITLAKQ